MFRNKHVVVAMLVAPVLAILAWFAVDYLVAERPHAAKPGASYTLVAKSNCRYASGRCDLENAGFSLSLRSGASAGERLVLTMDSSHPLQTAVLALVDEDAERQLASMSAANEARTTWQGTFNRPEFGKTHIRVAVTANNATWYAEIPSVFASPAD